MALNLLTYQQLAQHIEYSTSAVSVYSPGANETVQVFVKISNISPENVKCSVFHDDNGTTYNETTAIIYEMMIQPGAILELDHIYMNDSTGNLAVQSDTSGALNVTVYGIVRSSA